jgi:uncharacterized membrane protein HdeD (DUF308 family)
MNELSLHFSISILWLVYVTAMSTHLNVALLPLIAGQDIIEETMRGKPARKEQWAMVLISIIPILLIAGMMLYQRSPIRWLNLIFAVLFLLSNIAHLIQHLRKQPPDGPQNLLLFTIVLVSGCNAYLSKIWLFE